MQPLLQLLLAFWPVLLLLYAPRVAQLVAVVIANRTKSSLDHRIPDDMPLTAGQWLEVRLRALRIGVDQVVTDKHEDAYRPHDKLIQLRDTTHFKADPVYWATAAHELGHAHNRIARPWLGALREYSTYACAVLVAVGVGSALGAVVYGIGSTLALWCFALASASRVTVLLDEAFASIYAVRALGAVPHRRAVIAVLVTAFLTYFVTYAGYALLLAQWSLIAQLPFARYELTTLGWIFATVLTAAAGAAATVKSGYLRWLPITLLVLLVWNVVDPAYAWWVVAALAASANVWKGLLHVPGALPYCAIARVAQKLEGKGVDRTWKFLDALRRGARKIRAGNARIEALQLKYKNNPPLVPRIAAYARFAYLPLLVVIFL